MCESITTAKYFLSNTSNFKIKVNRKSWNRFISVINEYFYRIGIITKSIKKTGWQIEHDSTKPGKLIFFNNEIYISFNITICVIKLDNEDLIIRFYNINQQGFTYFNNSVIALCRLIGYGFDPEPILPITINEEQDFQTKGISCESIILSYKENKIMYTNNYQKYEVKLEDKENANEI